MDKVKARLKVVLMADDTTVAEVEDPVLWGTVLAAINTGTRLDVALGAKSQLGANGNVQVTQEAQQASIVPGNGPVDQFAGEVGVDIAVLKGALDPVTSDPFLHLDSHHWEAMRRQLPMRGPNAIGPIVLAATILCLWGKRNGMGGVSKAQAQGVLQTIGSRDNNPGRNLAGAPWLQTRPGGQILINPSQVSKAVALTRCFCTQDWSAWKS